MRIGACLLLFILAVGCASKDKVPSDIIPQDKMEKILWDMIQADQYAALYLAKDSARINVKMETLKLYQQVFTLHKVSRDEFRESFQYYLGRPDLTRPVFDSLLAQGNRLRADSYRNPTPVSPTPSVTPVIPKTIVPGPMSRPVGNGKGTKQTRMPITTPIKPGPTLPVKVPGPVHVSKPS
jgi:uncharacterized protein DUF4296